MKGEWKMKLFMWASGVTASALVCHHNDVGYNDVTWTKGGSLVVNTTAPTTINIRISGSAGPAEKAFEGKV